MEAPASTTEDTLHDGDERMATAVCRGAVTVDLIESGVDGGVGGPNENVRIPRQLWRMVEALLERSAHQQSGLFVEKGVELEVRGIQEALQSGSEFPEHCSHSMVEVRESVANVNNLSPGK